VVPVAQVVPLPDGVPAEQGACLGIPGITAHRAVHVPGAVDGRTLLVQGGAGAVGLCAVRLASHAGARVIATVRSEADEAVVKAAGAERVVQRGKDLAKRVRALVPAGVDHIVEVAFGANIADDVEMLRLGGSIATYATDASTPDVPFWPLIFKNITVFFVGSDDVPAEAKREAALALNDALIAGWDGFPIADVIPLSDIASAHEHLERPGFRGRIVVSV
jgi:NADPH2:quinone reductase